MNPIVSDTKQILFNFGKYKFPILVSSVANNLSATYTSLLVKEFNV